MKKGFAFLGMEWTGEIQEKFEAYRGLILEWNKKFNLTAILDEQEMAVKHFVDSLTIYPHLNRNGFLADVGSGAGFPGIPLKIAGYPGEMCLMDSLSKRVGFLDEAIRVLNLAGTRALHIRAEDAGRMVEHREKYDTVVTRAVSSLGVILEYGLPLVKIGGVFIAMQGREKEKAEKAMHILGGRLHMVETVELPFDNILRNNVYVKKTEDTPPAYPRRPGIPDKKPL